MLATAAKVTDYWAAINGSVSALAIVIGGALAVGRFRKERPYFARANLFLIAELLVDGHDDFVKVALGAKSIGKQSLKLVQSSPITQDLGCFVAVYPYRGEPATTPLGRPIKFIPVFRGEQVIDSGEVIEESVMFPIGLREADVLAYRVEFGFETLAAQTVIQKYILAKQAEKIAWRTSTFVAAGLQPGGHDELDWSATAQWHLPSSD
jgi:hypothetical protein